MKELKEKGSAMEAVGKILHKDSGTKLEFFLGPTSFEVKRNFVFEQEPLLGQEKDFLTFKGGGLQSLKFALSFDRDVDNKWDFEQTEKFLNQLQKVKGEVQSVSLVEFTLGSFYFLGFVRSYDFKASKFDNKGKIAHLDLSMELIQGEHHA